jgi:DNA-binding PadR family transcriptional regulator
MERKLLLLGLLRSHEMHGYQLNEIIDTHLGTSVHLKKPTAYRLLNEMADDGWITYREEREGNRPSRRVYAITSQGEATFQQLLRDSLANYKPAESRSDISLAFLDVLPGEETLSLLHQRRAVITSLLQTLHTDAHHGSFQLVIDHKVRHLSTELEWLAEIIGRIKTSQDHTVH